MKTLDELFESPSVWIHITKEDLEFLPILENTIADLKYWTGEKLIRTIVTCLSYRDNIWLHNVGHSGISLFTLSMSQINSYYKNNKEWQFIELREWINNDEITPIEDSEIMNMFKE